MCCTVRTHDMASPSTHSNMGFLGGGRGQDSSCCPALYYIVGRSESDLVSSCNLSKVPIPPNQGRLYWAVQFSLLHQRSHTDRTLIWSQGPRGHHGPQGPHCPQGTQGPHAGDGSPEIQFSGQWSVLMSFLTSCQKFHISHFWKIPNSF